MLINCNGNLVDLTEPSVMAIINTTPDSFFDGGRHNDLELGISKIERAIKEGAKFIDIGGYSSRPFADKVSLEEELSRTIPLIKLAMERYPDLKISIDTFRSEVARKAIEAGACMINDISAGNLDSQMFSTVASLNVPYIIMHMQGTPQDMQINPKYDKLIPDIKLDLANKVDRLKQLGVNDILIDPGFGFGKTNADNFEMLNNLDLLRIENYPILIGISRKSMIYKSLNTSPQEALNGTTAIHSWALDKGANILRVHDVKEAVEVIQLFNLKNKA